MAYTDRFPIVKNFLETKLTADCDAGETTLYLENVDGLPTFLSGRDYVPLVLRDAGTVREIVYVDAVDSSAGTVTVRRGQEGTTPAAWATGTYAYCTVTSDSFQRMRVNGFAPLVTDEGRPSISRTSATTVSITGDFSTQLEVGMAVRVLSGDTVVEPTDDELGAIHITSVSFSAGVTAVSFQNVSLPNKVDGLDLGLSVAAAPLYHPDMVVADEDTLTQTQNVLSVSQKFKDDLKAELDKRDEAQATRDAEQDAAIAGKLSTRGGTMTGHITRTDWLGMNRDTDASQLNIIGGNNAERCAHLALYGADNPDLPGVAALSARDGVNVAYLNLYPNGTASLNGSAILTSAGGNVDSLTVANKNVVKSVNGVAADAAGDVALKAIVTETWTSGSNWYRKWSDGFIEQGGWVDSTSAIMTVTFHTPFPQKKYTIALTDSYSGYTNDSSAIIAGSPTTTSFKVGVAAGNLGVDFSWNAFGY